MGRPTTTSPLDDPSHSALHNGIIDIRMFDPDVGTGGDDTQAFRDALDEQQANGGTIFVPASATADYQITDTIDLSGMIGVHIVGGHKNTGILSGQAPPAVVIDGTTITTGSVFYTNQGGTSANHRWENLSVRAGRTGFHYLESSNIEFENVAVRPYTQDGNSKNAAVVMENSFWGWYHRGAFHSPDGDDALPSVILLSRTPMINAASGLHRFHDMTFWGGGVEAQVNMVPSSYGNIYFENCINENTATPLLKITGSASSTWRCSLVGMRNCEPADQHVSPLPMIEMDQANGFLDAPIIESCQTGGQIAVQVTSGSCDGAFTVGGWGTVSAVKVVNAAGTATAGSSLAMKTVGFDLVGTEPGPTETDPLLYAGPAIRLSKSGESASRHGISTDGTNYWGSGSAAYDTNLYRYAADVLKTDDKLVAVAGIGVGNSAAATTPGSVVKKMQVFDETGASLGYVPVYDAIT